MSSGDQTSLFDRAEISVQRSHIETDCDFRPIHYLGSKLRMLDAIETVVAELAPQGTSVCDLFAGSGSVSRRLSRNWAVTSVDIQEYSRVLCSALMSPAQTIEADLLVGSSKQSDYFLDLENAVSPVATYEKECIERATSDSSESLCDFLESSSVVAFETENSSSIPHGLRSALNETVTRLKRLKNSGSIEPRVTRYFGGVYFSFQQAISVDSILHQISAQPLEHKDTLLAAVLSTVSDIVNTVGKQFAQPLRPRRSDGSPKRNLVRMVRKDRELDGFRVFHNWLRVYNSLEKSRYGHSAHRIDFKEAFELIDSVRVVYADPPYTRDHYSRYYHVLETICLQDSPNISRTKIGGNVTLSRGLYRDNRHQSPFCIKSQAPSAFETLFLRTAKSGASLVLSYSPYSQSARTHPRVMTIDSLVSLAKKHFLKVDIRNPARYKHSKLNRRDKHLAAEEAGETLLVCTNSL